MTHEKETPTVLVYNKPGVSAASDVIKTEIVTKFTRFDQMRKNNLMFLIIYQRGDCPKALGRIKVTGVSLKTENKVIAFSESDEPPGKRPAKTVLLFCIFFKHANDRITYKRTKPVLYKHLKYMRRVSL